MTDVKTSVVQLAPLGAATNAGVKIGLLASTAKAAQNDTVTITNAASVLHAELQIVATGAAEPHTISGKTITLTSATATAVQGIVYYK